MKLEDTHLLGPHRNQETERSFGAWTWDGERSKYDQGKSQEEHPGTQLPPLAGEAHEAGSVTVPVHSRQTLCSAQVPTRMTIPRKSKVSSRPSTMQGKVDRGVPSTRELWPQLVTSLDKTMTRDSEQVRGHSWLGGSKI